MPIPAAAYASQLTARGLSPACYEQLSQVSPFCSGFIDHTPVDSQINQSMGGSDSKLSDKVTQLAYTILFH